MGIDAKILFKVKNGKHFDNFLIPFNYSEICAEDYSEKENSLGATHFVDFYERFYGPGYERGPWPTICGILMELFASGSVEKVWYGGDDFIDEITPSDILDFSKHYMEHGCRPYYDRSKT